MKISSVQARWLRTPLNPPLRDSLHELSAIDWILVEVEAGGIVGNSYMLSFDFAPRQMLSFVTDELQKHALGMESDNIQAVFERMLRATEYVGQSGLAMWAVSAIDTALWDLLAKKLGVSASILFGRYTCEVPAYASGGWLSYSDDELVAKAIANVTKGFRAIKLKINNSVGSSLRRVGLVREAVGYDIQIMVDANQGLEFESALRISQRLWDLNVVWLEEPFRKDDLANYSRLRQHSALPIAAGEREFGQEPFARLVNGRCIDIVQPDLMRIGGVTNWLKVAHLSESNMLRVAPHFYKEFDVHLSASLPNLIAIEWFDWIDPLLVHPLQLRNGMAVVPDGPGFGSEFRQDAIDEFEVRL